MTKNRILLFFILLCLSELQIACQTAAVRRKPNDNDAVNVLTQKYDLNRSGVNLNEKTLNPQNINAKQFGMIFKVPVDGDVYTQPLYVSNLELPGLGFHNVMFVGTMHNSLYAIDAENGKILWKINLGTSIPVSDYHRYKDICNEIGILSTPVIDLNTKTIYLVTGNKEANKKHVHRLHAIDIVTHEERSGSPVLIEATAAGTGGESQNGVVTYDAFHHLQRISLALDHGQIIFATGGHADDLPYHGWLFAYDAATLKQTGVFLNCPNGNGGGFWESGQAPAIDGQGNIFMSTGNGFKENPALNLNDRSNSVVKFTLDQNGFKVADYYTPHNWVWMDAKDYDLGVSGVLLIPNSNLVIGGSKIGYIYNLKRDHLGGLAEMDKDVHQEFQAAANHVHAAPIFWNNRIYLWSENDYLKAYSLNGELLGETPEMQSTFTTVMHSMPGGMLSISSNGNETSSGVLWSNMVLSGDANQAVRPGILRAFDASDLTKELWNSEQNRVRDSFGNFAKFTVPTVANGKVYLATFSNQVVAYGLLGTSEAK